MGSKPVTAVPSTTPVCEVSRSVKLWIAEAGPAASGATPASGVGVTPASAAGGGGLLLPLSLGGGGGAALESEAGTSERPCAGAPGSTELQAQRRMPAAPTKA